MSDERASEEEAEQNGAENAPTNGDASITEDTNGDSAAVRESGADSHADSEETDAAPEPTDLEKAITDRDRMRDQLLRIAADFDNFRKRSRREIEDARRRSQEDTIREILLVIDNLERAEQAARSAEDVQAVADGVRMVLRGFDDVATRLGITRVKVVGEQFDPNLHDAMQQLETNEHPPGTIVAEIVAGYMMGERLLRPAMVVVAKPLPATAEAPIASEQPVGSIPPANSKPPVEPDNENVFLDENGANAEANSEPPKEGGGR